MGVWTEEARFQARNGEKCSAIMSDVRREIAIPGNSAARAAIHPPLADFPHSSRADKYLCPLSSPQSSYLLTSSMLPSPFVFSKSIVDSLI